MKRIALFASHNGSIFETLYAHSSQIGSIKLIISNNTNPPIFQKAKQYDIDHYTINNKLFDDVESKIIEFLEKYQCDIIVLAGYMKKITPKLANKYTIINSHPSLLPKYGGVGMYGKYVHEAVISAKERQSGVTIHYVNENYDEGNIILQKTITLDENETTFSLERKIKELEKIAYIEALNLV